MTMPSSIGATEAARWLAYAAAFAAAAASLPLLVRAIDRYAQAWRGRFEQDVSRRLADAFVFVDPRRLFVLQCVAVALLSPLAGWASGTPLVALAVALTLGLVPGIVLARMRRRRLERFLDQFPDALLLIASSLRAGASTGSALAEAAAQLPAPVCQELSLVLRELKLGLRLDAALARLERRVPVEDVTLFGTAMRISRDTGGNLAETLEALSEAVRTRRALEGKLQALTAQGRMQAWVMTMLPALVLACLHLVDPSGAALLWSTAPGWVVLVVVVALQATGLAMIRRIMAIDF